jgi:hypothetical protein
LNYGTHVTWAQAVIWALTGAVVAEAALLYNRIRHNGGRIHGGRPSRQDFIAETVAVMSRVTVGAGLAAAGAASGQICEAGAAFLAGLAGPVLVAKLFQIVGSASLTELATTAVPTQVIQPSTRPQHGGPTATVAPPETATMPRKATDASR